MRVEIRFELGSSVELALFDKFVAAVETVREARAREQETGTGATYTPTANAVTEAQLDAELKAGVTADSITEASVVPVGGMLQVAAGPLATAVARYTNDVDDIKLATLVRAHAATFGAAATVQVLGTFGAKRVSDVAADKRGELANALASVKGAAGGVS